MTVFLKAISLLGVICIFIIEVKSAKADRLTNLQPNVSTIFDGCAYNADVHRLVCPPPLPKRRTPPPIVIVQNGNPSISNLQVGSKQHKDLERYDKIVGDLTTFDAQQDLAKIAGIKLKATQLKSVKSTGSAGR